MLKVNKDSDLLKKTVHYNNHILKIDLLKLDEIFQEKRIQEKDERKFNFMIFSYKEYSCLTSDQLIGNIMNPFCTETAKAETDLHLGILEKKIYFDFLTEERLKLNNREILFLHENFFFNPIKKSVFETRYFKELIVEEFPRGCEIFRENSEVNEIFIIKDGSIELTIRKNLLDLHNLAKNLSALDESVKNFTKKFNEFELSSQPRNYIEKLIKKSNFLIFKFCSKEIMGIEDYFYNVNHSYTATVVSKKAKVYRLCVNKLNELLNDEPKCQNEFKRLAFTRMTLLLERLYSIKNSSLEFIDSKYSNSVKREFLLRSSEKNLLCSNHNSVHIKKQRIAGRKIKHSYGERPSFLSNVSMGNSEFKNMDIQKHINKDLINNINKSHDIVKQDKSLTLEKLQKEEKEENTNKSQKIEILNKKEKRNEDIKNTPLYHLKTESSNKESITHNTNSKHEKNEKLKNSEKVQKAESDYLEFKKLIYEESQIKMLKNKFTKLQNEIKINKLINHYDTNAHEILDSSLSKINISQNHQSSDKSSTLILYVKSNTNSNNSLISQLVSTKDTSYALVNLLPDITTHEKRRKTFAPKTRTTLNDLKEKKFITANEFSKVKNKFLVPMLNKWQNKLVREKNSKKTNKKESEYEMLVVNTKEDNQSECLYNKSEESIIKKFNKEIDKLETNEEPIGESWMITGS